MKNKKRIFWGLNISAPWPEDYPKGKIISPENRHVTLAFLGDCVFEEIQKNLESFPKPAFEIGLIGKFFAPIFLPKKTPHVVAWEFEFLEKKQIFLAFYEKFIKWLKTYIPTFKTSDQFLFHVSICRNPEDIKSWEKHFESIPMFFSKICLFESLGNSTYQTLWSFDLTPPFYEIHHTADIAYKIMGKTFSDLFYHAKAALAFQFPRLLQYSEKIQSFKNIEEVIMQLNEIIAEVDAQEGVNMKAVSFHGDVCKKNALFHWEMIIDV